MPSRVRGVDARIGREASRVPVRSARSPQFKLQHALRERVKELELLYAISDLREEHASSIDGFLQGVVERLPRAWQYPRNARARIAVEGRQFRTRGFRGGPWRMSQEVRHGGQRVGEVEIFYPRNVPAGRHGPFLPEEHALLRVVAERIGTALAQMRSNEELREAHQLLHSQHQALEETNIALRTVLSRLEEEKRAIRNTIMLNVQKIIMPIVFELELSAGRVARAQVNLLRQSLQEITSSFFSDLARDHQALAPVELAISTMIRNGLSTKEIARLRGITSGTVRRHRENIRRKLGLTHRKANLVTFLQGSSPG